MEQLDPADRYGTDIFYDALPEGDARTLANSFLQFARTVSNSEDEQVLNDYPELYQCIPTEANSIQVAAELVALLKRQGATLDGAVSKMIGRARLRLARGEVPATSLVRLAIGESPTLLELPLEGNLLRREGDTWTVVFKGKRTTVKALRGMDYLAYLIERQGEEVEARNMEAELFPNVRSVSAQRNREQARKAVTTAINGAVAAIRTKNPLLAQHLDAALRLGTRPVYAPSAAIEWRL